MNKKLIIFWLWARLFETSVMASTICLAAIAGVSIGWIFDDRPLADNNPDESASYVETPRIHAGDEMVVRRSFRRTDDCMSHANVGLLSYDKKITFPLQNYMSLGMPTTHYGVSRLGFMTPLRQAPGRYWVHTVIECQRNPLSLIAQPLPDLPIEIVTPGLPLDSQDGAHP